MQDNNVFTYVYVNSYHLPPVSLDRSHRLVNATEARHDMVTTESGRDARGVKEPLERNPWRLCVKFALKRGVGDLY